MSSTGLVNAVMHQTLQGAIEELLPRQYMQLQPQKV